MKSRTKLITLLAAVTFIALLTAVFAEQTPANTNETALQAPSFPYIAQITGDNVIVRSGPGTNYYACGRLFKTDKVRIVGTQFSWSRIAPPPGSFSWISKEYVAVDPENPATGTVTGDVVRVYAGAPRISPRNSTTTQTRLNTGDAVILLGEEQDNYYKIAPPADAYLWVSTQYTRQIAEPVVMQAAPQAATEPVEQPAPVEDTAAVADTVADITAAEVADVTTEAAKLKIYKALEAQIKEMRAKPADQQDYADIKNKLTALAGDITAGKAARYAEYTLQQVARIELALQAIKEVQLQDKQLELSLKRIEKARAEKLAELPKLGRFAVVGILQKSSVFGSPPALKHYRVIDETGKTICYALAVGQAADMDLTGFVGRKVGLVGTIEPHLETAGSLVKFNNIIGLK